MSTRKLPSLEGMERIPHTDIPEKLDEMLERIEKEDIARLISFRNNPSDESWIGEAK